MLRISRNSREKDQHRQNDSLGGGTKLIIINRVKICQLNETRKNCVFSSAEPEPAYSVRAISIQTAIRPATSAAIFANVATWSASVSRRGETDFSIFHFVAQLLH
jgi:hypothetical protein